MQQDHQQPNNQESNNKNEQSDLFNELFSLQTNPNKPPLPSTSTITTISKLTNFVLEKLTKQKQQPWKLLSVIPALIQQLACSIEKKDQQYGHPNNNYAQKQKKVYTVHGNVYFQNGQSIYIGSGTVIEHGAYIRGPCIIGKNCQIRKGAYIRGNAIIGDGTLIGNSCEVKNAILMDGCQIAHFNYIGDSILGLRAHFSAGSITSNYKLDGSQIKISTIPNPNPNQQPKQSGRNKLGALVGHNVEIGCNSILNPGSVIGQNSVIYPMVNWRGFLSRDRICKLGQQQQIVERK